MKTILDDIELEQFTRASSQVSVLTTRLFELAAQEDLGSSEDTRALLQMAMLAVAQAEQKIQEQKNRINYLENLSLTDELTGALNRRGFKAELKKALSSASRRKQSGILIICDLDGFKEINDLHGHGAGDAVLISVAQTLLKHVRSVDTVARLGGDEFAILLNHSAQADAISRAETLKTLINRLIITHNGISLAVKASFGIISYDGNSTEKELFAGSDKAMYADKRRRVKNPRNSNRADETDKFQKAS